jgi:hypothetical protein
MNSNKTAWDTYKLALSKGEINAETFALLTADLPRKGTTESVDTHCEQCDNGTDTPCTACLWEETTK